MEEKLTAFDPEVDHIIRAEIRYNEGTINLIASENYPPKSLMKALSSMLSGIYSEGYPGERWYRGLEHIDKLESLAIERAKAIFGAEHANVQALSGSNANIAGLVVAGAHPDPVPFCDVVTTTTHKTLRMTRGAIILCKKALAAKVDRAVFPTLQGGPHQSNISAIAVGLKHLNTTEYKQYIQLVVANATALVQELKALGASIVSDGTDNHLLLMDLSKQHLDGETSSIALEKAHIIVNKNKIPGDQGTAKKPSGIRLGSPAISTRGMGSEEVRLIAKWVMDVIKNPGNEAMLQKIKAEVRTLCAQFPIYKLTF